MGYWVAVGFGTSSMQNADIVLCQFKYTGNSQTDFFMCTDRYSSGYFLPVQDENDNVKDIGTTATFTSVNGKLTGSLSAQFDRPLDTQDIQDDTVLKQSTTIYAIWAHG